jgi:hypothetical protein
VPKEDTHDKEFQAQDLANQRSRREIKKTRRDSSLTSEELEESLGIEDSLSKEIYEHTRDSADIVMEGSLIYRHEMDQLELEGAWSMSNDNTRENFSYLLLKEKQNFVSTVKFSEIDFSDLYDYNQEYMKKYLNPGREEYLMHICAANLFEALLIPHSRVFEGILQFLSGEYHGFFLYYNKTIEDRFYLNFSLEDNQVRINGMKFLEFIKI